MAAKSSREAPGGLTRILPVDPSRLGTFTFSRNAESELDEWGLELSDGLDASHLCKGAESLRKSDVPVAFPTETVYGLGADATRSSAVQGIYKAKQRPSDNPLIVHICSLNQLRDLLKPMEAPSSSTPRQRNDDTSQPQQTITQKADTCDPIPDIYKPLIQSFWPGPLTILLRNPENSRLAPEVTAGLPTFGARMPKSLLALALIKLANVPIAAPSANASTKPSPTTADHVFHDLNGRLDIILDGGPCEVGVESTVVDGLSNPPSILRPGGISIEQLRECPGWENVIIGYKDGSEKDSQPRAPGMKYRHYSPKATVILHEAGSLPPTIIDIQRNLGPNRSIGIIRTSTWEQKLVLPDTDQPTPSISKSKENLPPTETTTTYPTPPTSHHKPANTPIPSTTQSTTPNFKSLLQTLQPHQLPAPAQPSLLNLPPPSSAITIFTITLGSNPSHIARNLFSALRDLDLKNVDVIFVEGVGDQNEFAAAIMNRLRKAAEVRVF
ncbi:MAG: hypothetical protein M1812_002837 [Candelaria pacifica]|nr:MAG: hypothetical protein M1812_002837 [Candelaria pacifica]